MALFTAITFVVLILSYLVLLAALQQRYRDDSPVVVIPAYTVIASILSMVGCIAYYLYKGLS